MKTRKSILKELKSCKKNIGKQRDKLRRLQDELSLLCEPVDRGMDDLRSAIAYFSDMDE